MSIPIVCIDAFTHLPFFGNPAAVALVETEAAREWMQSLAAEINLSETAFLCKLGDNRYALRWFTPTQEVDLCGHATLASAHFLLERKLVDTHKPILFEGIKHALTAIVTEEGIRLDFPLVTTAPVKAPEGLLEGLGLTARPVFAAGDDFLVEVESRTVVRHLSPDMAVVKRVKMRGVIVTAEGDHESSDFVSRFFAPGVGIDEDPVTGSAHCALAHFWSSRLGKRVMLAEQLSERGGGMTIEIVDDRVWLTGRAVTIWAGMVSSPPCCERPGQAREE